MNLRSVSTILSTADPRSLISAIALIFRMSFVQAWRWGLVMHVLAVPLHWRARIVNCLIGQFFNQTLPSTIGGDAVRILLLRHTMPLRLAAHGILIDRLCALFALLVIGAISLPWLTTFNSSDNAVTTVAMALGAPFTAMLCLLFLDRVPARIRDWRIIAAAATLSTDARRALLTWHPGPLMLLVSISTHASVCFAVWLLAHSVGLNIELLHALVLVPLVMVVSAIPISVAGWGMREGAMVAAFGLNGVPAEGALAVSILLGLAPVMNGLPGGVLWLLNKRKHSHHHDNTGSVVIK